MKGTTCRFSKLPLCDTLLGTVLPQSKLGHRRGLYNWLHAIGNILAKQGLDQPTLLEKPHRSVAALHTGAWTHQYHISQLVVTTALLTASALGFPGQSWRVGQRGSLTFGVEAV